MCNICEVKKGNCELLAEDKADLMIGRAKLGEIALDVFISNNEDGTWEIESSMFVSEIKDEATVKLPIKYCPFCGRNLHEEKKTEYPWNKD